MLIESNLDGLLWHESHDHQHDGSELEFDWCRLPQSSLEQANLLARDLPLQLHRTVPQLGDLADLGDVLDEWTDELRSSTVTLHPLRGDLKDRGFLGVARSGSGALIVQRIFLETDEGLRALTEAEMKQLLAADGPWRRLRRRLLSILALTFLVVGMAACGSTNISPTDSPAAPSAPFVVGQCEALVPRALPSGAEPGPPRLEGQGRVSWGVGSDQVGEAVNEFGVGDPATFGVAPDSRQWVAIRGARALVIPIGEEGVGQVAITWSAGDCPYTLWLAPGHTLDDGIRYAAQF